MSETDPGKIKQLGKQVKNFDPKVWYATVGEIAETGINCKFDQNPEMKTFLLQQKGKIIGEMSPKDNKWGTGIGLYHAKATNHKEWPGENMLGQMLMKTRDSY